MTYIHQENIFKRHLSKVKQEVYGMTEGFELFKDFLPSLWIMPKFLTSHLH